MHIQMLSLGAGNVREIFPVKYRHGTRASEQSTRISLRDIFLGGCMLPAPEA